MVEHMTADQLVSNATHDSVTKDRLTELKGGFLTRYLNDTPLIGYLGEGEQPEFILFARQYAPTFNGPSSPFWSGESLTDGMAMHMITDRRWIMVAGMKNGDESFDIPLGNDQITDYSTGTMKHEITMRAGELYIEVPISNTFDSTDIERLVEYIREFESAGSDENHSDEEVDPMERLSQIKDLHDEGILTDEEFEEKKREFLDKI